MDGTYLLSRSLKKVFRIARDIPLQRSQPLNVCLHVGEQRSLDRDSIALLPIINQ